MIQSGPEKIKVNLADRSKNPKAIQKGLNEWDESNDAEMIDSLRRRGAIKNLNPDAFVRPSLTVGATIVPDSSEGYGFKVGDRVQLSRQGIAAAALAGLPQHGRVTGIRDGFIRVGKELYTPSMWEHLA
jgi:hypothetical protein